MPEFAADEHRSPNYYVRKRLFKNKLAVFGLVLIGFATLITLMGYWVLPDQTPNANDGAIQIAKKLPGFKTTLLKIRINREIGSVGFLKKLIYGEPSPYTLVPVSDYRLEGYNVHVNVYGSSRETDYHLLEIVKPLFIGTSGKLGANIADPYVINGDQVRYLDLHENEQTTTRSELLSEFEQHNLEERRFLLGTDQSGRDLLSRLLFGTRISFSIGFVSVLISMFLGITMGALAGFFRGKVDAFILWFMSVIWSIPGIMLVIAISLALNSRGVWVAFVAVGLTMWVDVARVVRGQFMSIKEKSYVEAARAFGIRNSRIIYAHILPNILGPLIVIASANFASAILLEAGLSFLGLSVQPPTPSWGIMIFEGFKTIGTPGSWHLVVFPGLAICLMVLSFNLLGNGLRDAFDPKTMLH